MTPATDSKRATLLAICLATFMLLLDITIVQVALPSIQRDLGTSLTGLQWVVDAYVLPLAALVVSFGTLADRFGRRLFFTGGLVVFTVASLACALAPNLVTLAVARAVQGVGGAGMFATALALIGQEFDGPARGRAIAAWGSTVGIAVAAGPLVGGTLIRVASWPWIFYVNVPIGVLTALLTLRSVAEGREPAPRRLDIPGLLTLSGGLLAFVETLLRGSSHGWSGGLVLGSLGVAVVLLAAFVVLQRRPHALFDPELFRSRAFNGVSIATFALGMGMFAMFLFITIFLQNVLGYSPLQGGLRMLAATVPVFVVPLVLRRLGTPVVSGRLIGSGLTLVAAGLALMTLADASASWWRIAPGLVVAGIGIGLANPSIAATALAVVAPTRSGLAAGVSNTCRLAGMATGIAALGAVLQTRVDAALPGGVHGLGHLVAAGRLGAAGHLTSASTAVRAYDDGFHLILITGAVIAALGATAAFTLARSVGGRAPMTTAPSAQSEPAGVR